MGAETKIEWCDYTFNGWIGCTKVAAGCKNCYAEADMDRRRKRVRWGPGGTRSRTSDQYWRQPVNWNRWNHRCTNCGAFCFHEGEHPDEVRSRCCNANAVPARPRVFCASLADVFEDWEGPIVNAQGEQLYKGNGGTGIYLPASNIIGATPETVGASLLTMADLRRDLFDLIDATPNLDWLLVTKRPENIRRMWLSPPCEFGDRCRECGASMNNHLIRCQSKGLFRPNVWLLTSVATQADAERNIPELLKCRDLAPVLGVSAEPLLEEIDLRKLLLGHCPRCGHDEGAWNGPCAACGHKRNDLPPLREDPTGDYFVASLDWLIVGGESGAGARPCTVGHVRSLSQQCQAAGVPCFVKQLGANVVNREGERCPRIKHPKGGDPSEWPEDLRVRQFPRLEADQ